MLVELGILSISSISGLTLFSFITPVARFTDNEKTDFDNTALPPEEQSK
jgi:hypothetical protein